MFNLRLCAVLALCVSLVEGQEMRVISGGVTYPAVVQIPPDNVYSVVIGGTEYYLLRRSILDSLMARKERAQHWSDYYRSVLTADSSLLAGYEKYRQTSETHIASLRQSLVLADSLYRGYRDLHGDLKRVAGFSTWSLMGSVGAGLKPETRALVSVGGTYYNWTGQYLFGGGFSGVLVGVRWGF